MSLGLSFLIARDEMPVLSSLDVYPACKSGKEIKNRIR